MHTTDDSRDPNGINLDAVRATQQDLPRRPELAQVRLRARNRWLTGAHSRSVSQDFHVALRRHPHLRSFVFELDYPELLGGGDVGPTPAEFVLYGLAGDLTAAVALVASERDVELTRIDVEVVGRLDARPVLGVPGADHAGYERIDVELALDGAATAEELAAIVVAARERAPVVATMTNSVPVHLEPVRATGGARGTGTNTT